ncbi:MAG TPA: hypothetical protein VLJ19_00490 [Variovorax sp.]|nr:hypothetical protein [Variovorax sp.]
MNPKNMVTGTSLLAFLFAMPAMAADEHGHDHGAPSAASGPALPRFSAVSEAFELVVVVSGRQLAIYLDSFEDNAPVKDADVDLEIGGAKVALKRIADGEYEGTLAEELEPGVIAVTATVAAGNDTDILAGDLVMHGPATAHDSQARSWRAYAAWVAGALGVLGGLTWLRRRAGSAQRAGGAA